MTCTVEITLHALSQRSPARSGIENSWPKGKAKVKGRSSYKQLLHPVLESHAKVLLLYFHKKGAVLSLSVKVPKDVPKANIVQTFAQQECCF